MSGLFRRLLGRDDPGEPREPVRHAGDGGAAERRARAGALVAALRDSAAELTAASIAVGAREEQLRRSAEQYDEIAKAAIANGRTIQAESAIASSEAATAALDALAPQAATIAELRAQVEQVANELERAPDTSEAGMRAAEERVRRLVVHAHDVAAPHRRRDGEG